MTYAHLLELCLMLAATGQLCIAILNLFLVRIMGWREELARISLLIRQVFHIHVLFISLTLAIFAALTFRFAPAISTHPEPIDRWLAFGIGLFWAVRAVLQVTYYSSSHWRGIPSRIVVHMILLVTYPAFALTYFAAALMK